MAPTSIDGNEIAGATIDGQNVSEITVDGQTVFTAIPDGVAVHLDAADESTIILDGNGNVQTWTDKSDNGVDFSQSDGSMRPSYNVDTLNGLDTVTFNPVEYLEVTNFPVSEPNTIAVVYRWDSGANRGAMMGFDAGTTNDPPSFNIYSYSPYNSAFGFNTWAEDIYGIAEDVRGQTHISQFVFEDGDPSTSNVEMRINGSERSLSSVRSGHNSLTRTSEFALGVPGHRATDANQEYDGYIAEIIVYERLLDSNERSNLDAYLNNKWSVF